MLSRPDALRLASALERLQERLPSSSRVAVARQMPTALGALRAYVAGGALDRQQVVTALVFLELELRQLGRMNGPSEADTAEREQLWAEVDAIAAGM